MLAVAIRALHHQQIAVLSFGRSGVDDLSRRNLAVAHTADVAGEQQPSWLRAGHQADFSHGRAQNVRRPHEAKREAIAELFAFTEVDRTEQLHALLRLFHGVKRQRRMMLRCVLLVVEFGVFFLQMAGVGQQNATQIDRGLCGVNRSVKSLFDQTRDPPRVVEVRVGEDDCVNGLRRDRQILPVTLTPFLLSLEESTIDQNLKWAASTVIYVDQVLRSRDNSGGAEKLYVAHALSCLPQ